MIFNRLLQVFLNFLCILNIFHHTAAIIYIICITRRLIIHKNIITIFCIYLACFDDI